MLMPSC
jgi:hypothetical protein